MINLLLLFRLQVYPLHSSVTLEEQNGVFLLPVPGYRKVKDTYLKLWIHYGTIAIQVYYEMTTLVCLKKIDHLLKSFNNCSYTVGDSTMYPNTQRFLFHLQQSTISDDQ